MFTFYRPSYRVGTGGFFPGLKRPGREGKSPASSAEVINVCGAVSPLPNKSSWCGTWLSTGYVFIAQGQLYLSLTWYGLMNCILLCISWIQSLLCSMPRLHRYVKVMALLQYYILPMDTVFGLKMVSEHCSEFPTFKQFIYFSSYIHLLFI